MWLAIIFIILGVFSRLLPHVPNFSPLVAIALFAGVYCNKKHGYVLPLIIFVISDLIIGLHNTIIFTWASIVLIYLLGVRLRNRKTVVSTFFYTIGSSLLFFLITNFGVWLMGWYPRNPQGFIQCYIYALPFFRVSLVANCLYVAVLFGAYEYFLSRARLAVRTT
jgi:hypothetical protein